jgi:hypothetical protein
MTRRKGEREKGRSGTWTERAKENEGRDEEERDGVGLSKL